MRLLVDAPPNLLALIKAKALPASQVAKLLAVPSWLWTWIRIADRSQRYHVPIWPSMMVVPMHSLMILDIIYDEMDHVRNERKLEATAMAKARERMEAQS